MSIETPPVHRSRLLPQLVKFGAVGAVGFVVNLVVFNGLLLTPLSKNHWGAIIATVIASAVAITTNYIGNRYWAFAAQRQEKATREGLEFFIISVAGMVIPVICVYVSRVVLGYDSRLADNIANNGVGLVLGTLFRFSFYRWWVFSPKRAHRTPAGEAAAEPVGVVPTTTLPTASLPTASLPAAPDSGLVGR
ncbi:GtrA family protein [Leifsonia poae]|uniref:GtrA family protein n=1 Tax=Leifsonia poae TaxID=110933 RepID=UPI001CBBDAE1|nr:GtrA family protein [Leifsonia poae]